MLHRFRGLPRRRKVIYIALGTFAALMLGAYTWLFAGLPSIDAATLRAGMALPSTRIYDRHGVLLYEILADSTTGGRNTAVPLDDIPARCQQAVIAVEDANFYTHPGVDIAGVARALWINLRDGQVVAGGSTITQQVARNLLFDPQQRAERSVRRKLREMILALQLQAAYSREDILALYLNQSYFGNLAYGIDAAAAAYFGKSAAELSLAECALLAGLLQSPATYDPLTNLEAAEARQSVVLGLMVQNGFIDQAAADAADSQPLAFAAVPFPIEAPHFVMWVIRQLERDYGQALLEGGLEVTTTLDLNWQNAAQAIVQQQLFYLNNSPNRVPAEANNAALVAMDPHTGQVLTLLGSPDYFDESIDGAVNAALALRQPGSTLKPFTYAAAFDPARPDAWSPATMILDIETPFVTRRLQSYTPLNYGLVEHGPVSAREALASSLNIPAVVTLDHVGIAGMIGLANNAGISTLANNSALDLAVTLGGGDVRLLELTQAFAAFPSGGQRAEPVAILRVDTHDGRTLYEWRPPAQRQQVMDERVAWLITDILSDDNARTMGFGRGSALNIGRPAAAKTGTTTDFRDNWIVGYTPNLVAGVWVGNADNTPMVDITGVSGAAPIWNAFMRQVLRGQPELEFTRPDGLVQMEVCAPSGLLPTDACPARRLDWFIAGHQPAAYDTMWQAFTIDNRTSLLAGPDTPVENRYTRVFQVLPQEARAWGQRHGVAQPPPEAGTIITAADDRLRLLNPDPYTIFELSDLLPADSQRIRLTAGAPRDTQSITYVLNGEPLATTHGAPWDAWWPLALGQHTLTAVATLGDGTTQTSAPVQFSVVRDAEPQSYTLGGG
jgi:1A family penicillin-binding protein